MMSGFFVFLMAASTPSFAATQWSVGVSGGDEGIRSFNLSIGDYYHVPEREVVGVHDRGIQEEELPVVFFTKITRKVDGVEAISEMVIIGTMIITRKTTGIKEKALAGVMGRSGIITDQTLLVASPPAIF